MDVQTFVVTGDRGFVGSRLTSRLLEKGATVIGVDVRPPSKPVTQGYKPVIMDLTNKESIRKLIESASGIKAVFHLAALLPEGDNDPVGQHIEANLKPTANLLSVLSGSGVPLVISSTMSVFGMPPPAIPVSEDVMPVPVESYGLAKLGGECLAERAARSGKVHAVVLRYSGIFGEGYSYGAIHLYTGKALAGEPIEVYAGGRLVRDYVHVDDVVQANIKAAEYATRKDWDLFHIGGGEPKPLIEIAEMVRDSVGQGEIRLNDRPGSFDFGFDVTRAGERLSYHPLSLKLRINQYVNALKKENER